MNTHSLRMRLIVIILTPLLVISIIAAAWQFQAATKRAEDIFDRGLLSAALAISRDVALSGGDALSPKTRRVVSDTSGGELFYHVFAPDGVFVTGYATPPATAKSLSNDQQDPHFYDAVYQGTKVRVLQFRDATTVDGITGLFTITVWQAIQVRTSFVRDVALRSIGVIALMVASVAAVVWFGVGIGLRPLLDLQAAIAKRSPSELEPIRRNVPIEVRGIVSTLNDLLDRVSRRISSKDEFISNAAHQLRNPIASILALAEAVETAPTPEAAKSRSKDVVEAAREATHLTNQLLSFERARGEVAQDHHEVLDISAILDDCLQRFTKDQERPGIELIFTPSQHPTCITGDKFMLQEAVLNLLNNAVVHGGPTLSRLEISVSATAEAIDVVIQDDGRGIDPEKLVLVMARFSQADAGSGSGLGLPIAERVIENHGGTLRLGSQSGGLKISITLPITSCGR
jgi:two-component system sensor histidine kinase TctE